MRKLSSDSFNNWKVLKYSCYRNRNHWWLCECKCGRIKECQESNLVRGDTKQCLWCSTTGKVKPKNICNSYFRILKNNAKKRNIDFSIDIEYIWEIFKLQNFKCNLTGIDIYFSTTDKEHKEFKTTASVDRIDNTKGYIKDNIQIIHKDLNIMKNVFSQEKFIEMCQLVYKHHKEGVD